jgi:hypothetical protein
MNDMERAWAMSRKGPDQHSADLNDEALRPFRWVPLDLPFDTIEQHEAERVAAAERVKRKRAARLVLRSLGLGDIELR